jgi:hypothetical protein
VLWDSAVHKDDLVNGLHGIDEALDDEEFGEAEGASLAVQEFFFWSTFTMRKLSDSFKLSDELLAEKWTVDEHPRLAGGAPVDFLNWDRIDTHYDLDRRQPRRVTLRQLCGLAIHSFVFLPLLTHDHRSVEGFYLNSDRTKERGVLFVPWSLLSDLINAVYDDDIVRIEYDRSTGSAMRSRQHRAGADSTTLDDLRDPLV